MLARQWSTVADECFAAMVTNLQQKVTKMFTNPGDQSSAQGEDQPGVQACSHGPQPGGGDAKNGELEFLHF